MTTSEHRVAPVPDGGQHPRAEQPAGTSKLPSQGTREQTRSLQLLELSALSGPPQDDQRHARRKRRQRGRLGHRAV
jgi:hypothetical protein